MTRTKLSSTHDAFLQAILENPDDETPRLIFADWLEEQGDPRGTFIRLQCQRAHMTRHDAGWDELLAQEAALRREHEAEWSKPVLRLVEEVAYRRGFIEHVRVAAGQFLQNAERLFRRAPVTGIGITRLEQWLPKLADCAYLGRAKELDLSYNTLGNKTALRLTQSSFIAQLISLRLNDCQLGPPGVRSLVTTNNLSQLRSLSLSSNHFFGSGASILADSPPFRLTSLNLGMNCLGNDGVAAIASSPAFADLRRLELRGNMIGNPGVEAIIRSPHLQRLEHLDLSNNRINYRGLQALEDCTTLSQLKYLNLEGNEIRADQTLANALNFPNLRELVLHNRQ